MNTSTLPHNTTVPAYTIDDINKLTGANLAASSLLSFYAIAIKKLSATESLASACAHLNAITGAIAYSNDDALKILEKYESGSITVHRCQTCSVLFAQSSANSPQEINCQTHR